jgi:hypothetical protein
MTLYELKEAIQNNIEWLSTTEEDEVECIGIENLEGILSKYFNTEIKLTEDGEL